MTGSIGDRLLYWLGVVIAVAVVTGVLLSVPPFTLFIFPIYEQVHIVHGWISLAAGMPFVAAVFAHGLAAWRVRGFSFLTKTGLLLTAGFVTAFATGWHARFAAEKMPWVLFVHLGSGIVTAVGIFLHIRRWSLPQGVRQRGNKGKAAARNTVR